LANYDTRAAGPYPAEITNAAGGTTLVVQAGEYQQYVGQLNVEFDPQGEPVNWSGDTIFLSHFITPDAGVSAEIEALAEPIAAMSAQVIGQSSIYLEGDRTVCRAAECNLGNLITDAMRAETGAQIAIENGGGIRASIQPGDVTLGDVLTVLPFGNLVSTFSLSGRMCAPRSKMAYHKWRAAADASRRFPVCAIPLTRPNLPAAASSASKCSTKTANISRSTRRPCTQSPATTSCGRAATAIHAGRERGGCLRLRPPARSGGQRLYRRAVAG
jgi:hypothetical protein